MGKCWMWKGKKCGDASQNVNEISSPGNTVFHAKKQKIRYKTNIIQKKNTMESFLFYL